MLGDASSLLGLEQSEREDALGCSSGGAQLGSTSTPRSLGVDVDDDETVAASRGFLAPFVSSSSSSSSSSSPPKHSYTLADARIHAPKFNDILNGTSTAPTQMFSKEELAKLPAHVKILPFRISKAGLQALYSKTPGVTETCMNAFRDYVEEAALYAKYLPPRTARDVPVARVPDHRMMTYVNAGLLEAVQPGDVKGYSIVFEVPELAKSRFRVIQHTKDVNTYLPDALPVSFTPLADRRRLVHMGSHGAELDFMAYYHHFELSPEVRNYHCVRVRMADGSTKLFRMTVAPTGQKHIVHLGCATTDLLLDFDHQSIASDSQIDNVLFVGSAEDVATMFKLSSTDVMSPKSLSMTVLLLPLMLSTPPSTGLACVSTSQIRPSNSLKSP
jgi:hypothetical protein